MCECKLILICAFVMCPVIFVTAFNIDQVNYASYKGNGSSMFGFTVAVHKDQGNNGWVLVGAPEAQSRFQSPTRAFRGGAVYRCRSDADDVCQEIPFSRESYAEFANTILDQKSLQWFGATLSSSGRIVACAPRYVWFTKDRNRRDPVGTCYVADGNFQNSEEYSPCRTMNWGYHRQGSCQAGFSAAIDRAGDRLFIGAPGSYYWQGQVYSVDAHAKFNFTPGIYGNKGYGAKGSVHQQSLATREAVFSTREGSAPDDDSYMGYSSVVGHFLDEQEYEGVAVGMPRGNGLRGKVLLFTWDLKNYKNLTVSKQIGAYFGYSITAADVNGDGMLDIIVGAPMHTEPNNDMKYDVGRVYIFHQTKDFATSFSNFTYIDGVDSRSRFGHSVSTLGDLNQDGFEDFAVGAPYAGPEGRGAVYIYYGSRNGILKKSEQVIYAKNIQTNIPLVTFGFSVTGGLDLDGNDYPDMAVGAYLSDAAFFFRAQPVAVVDAYVRFRTSQKQIDIKKKNCVLPSGLEAICTDVDFCMKYTGKGIPSRLYFSVEYILDTKKPNATRMGFFSRRSDKFVDTVLLDRERQTCKSERVFIKSDMRDKLTPLEAEMKYSIVDDASSAEILRNPRSHLRPALDLNSPPSRKDSIVVQKNCGPDNVCIPDLHVTIDSNVKRYLLGSQNNLEFDVVVSNFGEDSFETTFEMKIPKGIFYKKVEAKPGMPGILCSAPGQDEILMCDVGNPLPAGKIASFKIVLQPTYQEETSPSYEFDVYVNSTNPELNATTENNHKHVSIDIWIDASLELRGDSYPPTVYYNESHYTTGEIVKENDIGPQVTHVYYVRNSGPATIQEAEVFILWPLQTLGGEDLLYLLDPPHTEGNVKCDAGLANYKNYIVGYHGDSIFDRLRIDTSSVQKVEKHTSITETGKGVSSGSGVENRNETLESEVTSSGDSSVVFQRRHNESESEFNTHGTINVNGEYMHTSARSRTVWVNGVPHTTWENTTVVKDARGNILNTYYTNTDPDNYFNNFTDTSSVHGNIISSGKNVLSGSSSGLTWSTSEQEARAREEQQREIERQQYEARLQQEAWRRTQAEEKRRQEEESRRLEATINPVEERRRQEEARIQAEERRRLEESRSQAEERRRLEESRIQAEERRRLEEARNQSEERRRQEEIRIQMEERRRQEETRRAEERRRQEEERIQAERRWQEEARRRQQGGYDEEEDEYDEYSTEEETGQGGVQESGRGGQYGQTITSGGTHSRVLTGYYDQQGVYHEYPRDPSGNIIYNRTYTVETTGSIPPGISGGQSSQHLGFDEIPIGGGFTVQTLDLGNAASESSLYGGQAGAVHGSSGSSRSQSQSGSFHGAGSQNSGSSGFREELYGQNQGSGQRTGGGGYSGDWHVEGSYSQSGQIPPTIVHNNLERDNVATDKPNPYARSRGKRATHAVDPYDEIQALVKCNATRCNYIRCVVGVLDKDKEVAIALRSRLNVREVNNLTSSQAIKLSSMIVGKISKLHMRSESGQILKEHEVFTEVPAKEAELVPEVAPLWIYVVSAVAGVVMLLLLIWILSKCGFFKRNRPSSSAPERQPLSRNGYHSGDEAL